MKKHRYLLLIPAVFLATALISTRTVRAESEAESLKPSDLAGDWEWITPSRQEGGEPRHSVLTLELKEKDLVGLIKTARGETKIEEVKLSGKHIHFITQRETQRGVMKANYSAKLEKDALLGTYAVSFGDRNFEREWKATRVVKVEGEWLLRMPGRDGQVWESTLSLKKTGEGYTGSIKRNEWDVELKDVQVKGSQVSYVTEFERDGQTFTMKSTATISGKTMKGKTEGERDGQTWSREWEAALK